MILAFLKTGEPRNLTYGLDLKEFECHCSNDTCQHTLVSTKLLWSYEKLRKKYGYRININSGFRCAHHNHSVGGKHASFHKVGLAIDISSERLEELYDIAKNYFDVVIKYDTFIHAHNKDLSE